MCNVRRTTAMITLLAAFYAGGCAHYPENPPLTAINRNAGYRYSVVREAPAADRPFLLLSFSGGGAR